jgi:hypothetical protein
MFTIDARALGFDGTAAVPLPVLASIDDTTKRNASSLFSWPTASPRGGRRTPTCWRPPLLG